MNMFYKSIKILYLTENRTFAWRAFKNIYNFLTKTITFSDFEINKWAY